MISHSIQENILFNDFERNIKIHKRLISLRLRPQEKSSTKQTVVGITFDYRLNFFFSWFLNIFTLYSTWVAGTCIFYIVFTIAVDLNNIKLDFIWKETEVSIDNKFQYIFSSFKYSYSCSNKNKPNLNREKLLF